MRVERNAGTYLNLTTAAPDKNANIFDFSAAETLELIAVWDSRGNEGAKAIGPDSRQGILKVHADIAHDGATSAWQYKWCLYGWDREIAGPLTLAAIKPYATLVYAPKEENSDPTSLTLGQGEALHLHRFYGLVITATTTDPSGPVTASIYASNML